MSAANDSDPLSDSLINNFCMDNQGKGHGKLCSDKNNTSFFVPDLHTRSFKQYFDKKLVEYDEQHQGSQRKPWTQERTREIIDAIKNGRVIMNSGQRRTAMEYYWMSKYDIIQAGNEDYLISKQQSPTGPIVRIIPREQYFDILNQVHESCGHGGRDKMLFDIKNKYYIPKKAVEMFVSLCPVCESKRNVSKRVILSRSIASREFNLRGQIDLIDFQSCPDGDYRWLLTYHDYSTKFLNLRALKTTDPVEIASELVKIFLIFGAPCILQSDNGREFPRSVIAELSAMWPDCKIVHGSPICPKQDGDTIYQDVERTLQAWMKENNRTDWSVGCYFVQYNKNAAIHNMIKRTPYKAVFGCEPKAGLSASDFPASALETIETEEQLEALSEQQSADAASSDNSNDNDDNLKAFNSPDVKVENFESVTNNIKIENDICEEQMCETYDNTLEASKYDDDKSDSLEIKVEPDIHIESYASQALKRPAENTIETTIVKLPKLEIGTDVIINIPKRVKNVQGKIVDISNGVYRIGTKMGTIKDWFLRQDLHISPIAYGNVISDTQISISEAVANQRVFDGQMFPKCACKPNTSQCRNNRCACFKNKVRCGTKCHGRLSCVNI